MGNPQNSFIGTSLNVSLFLRGLSDEQIFSSSSGEGIRLKRHQRKKSMERKVKGTPESAKPVLDVDEEKTIILTILVALVILGALLVNLALSPAPEEKFVAIYLLNSEKQAENFPKTVILGENSTFSLWVGVENQNATTEVFSVQVKVDDGKSPVDPSPAESTQSFEKTLVNKEIWEFPVRISIDQLGSNMIIFELWFFNGTTLEYTGNWVNLSIEAVQS